MVERRSEVLFCTEAFWSTSGDRVRELAPDVETVLLTADQKVADADLERVTIAFFSHDAWPRAAESFLGSMLRAPNLRWLHSMSAGVDSPVFGTFRDNGVRVSNSPGASAPAIARTAMMFLLALARDLPRLMRAQASEQWAWEEWDELIDQRVAILGWGPIGQEIARLADAFGMHPTILRRFARGDEPYPTRPLSELADVAAEVDALVVALPLTDDTRRLVSADVLAAMQPHALFVNIGRGEVVDQAALTMALSEGALRGAGLDVTDPEPLPAGDPLWALPNVIITPHSSGSSDGSGRRVTEQFLANLATWVDDESLASEI